MIHIHKKIYQEQVFNMKRDKVIEDLLVNVQAELKEKYGVEFTTTEIYNIVDSQFEFLPIAMENKQTVKINLLGKFTIKKGREDAIETNRELIGKNLEEDRKKEIIKARAYKAKGLVLDFRQNKENEII